MPESVTDPTVLDRLSALWSRLRAPRRRLPRNIEFENPAQARRYRESMSAAAPTTLSARLAGRADPHGTEAEAFAGEPESVVCPRCGSRAALEPLICAACGFPFICDIEPVDRVRVARRSVSWRVLLGTGALIFWLTNVALVAAGSGEYQGLTTRVAAGLTPVTDSGIVVTGPDSFVHRTQLALDLMRRRAPDVYYRMRTNVTSIDYLDRMFLEHGDTKITLEGIGALATPSTGRVQVLLNTAFPSGAAEFWDADVFSYAGVLVHELRHIELYRQGIAPGGWEEEVLCEQAAYEALLQMGAPGGVLTRYQIYLANPHARRYQHWYDWYNQF